MNFAVYKSSAGSGKTHTLVREYLAIILRKPSLFRNILAVTFTNKAANEMRERIIRSLTELSHPDRFAGSPTVSHMLPELEKETGLPASDLSENASQALTLILHSYQDFSVSTIDSFIHRVVRTFAFDLHLPLNFEVEVDEEAMVSQAVDLLMSRVGIDEVPTKVLAGFAASRVSDEMNWNIEQSLKSFARHLLRDDVAEFLPGLQKMDSTAILKAGRHLSESIRRFENEVVQRASTLMSFWKKNGIGVQDLYYGKTGIYGYIDRLSNGNLAKLKPTDRVRSTIGDDCWYSENRIDAGKKALIDGLKGEMIDLAGGLLNFIDEGYPGYELYRILKKNIFPLAVLNEILKVIDQIRETDGLVHISEFDKRIATVVNNEPVPFIYERLGERYSHFLVDEFQDTSVLEWQNILPLIENALSVNSFSMVVGDPKQAIYRFKGGEVEQLVKLPAIHGKRISPELSSRELLLKRNYVARELKRNFRSREVIIRFNNDLYTFAATRLPGNLRDIYSDCVQEIPGQKQGGSVQIRFMPAGKDREEREAAYLEEIYSSIIQLCDEGGYAWRDIAILCRSNREASRIASNLLLRGIGVVSAESLLLASSPEVTFLVACLGHLINETDTLWLTTMITYLSGKKGLPPVADFLARCFSPVQDENPVAAPEMFRRILIGEGIGFNPLLLTQMGLYERAEALVRIFDLNHHPDPYVLFFLDLVREYASNSRFSPEEFLTFWEDNIAGFSIVVPEGINAVQVMTIHKAKGLQFPVVIYPFANDKVEVHRNQRWVDLTDAGIEGLDTALLPMLEGLENTSLADVLRHEKDMARLDMLNILYVATTRPAERLFIICDRPASDEKEIKNVPSLLRGFLEHIQMWDDAQDDYVFGNLHPLNKNDGREDAPLKLSAFVSADWRKNIVLSAHAADYWDLDDDSRNLEWGNLVHRLLSKVVTAGDLPAVIAEEVAQGNLLPDKAMELNNLLKEIIGSEEAGLFFDGTWDIRNEAAIMTAQGKEYRPDRIMFGKDRAIILDYKTGRREEGHYSQMETYGHLLEEMGHREIEKYLLYLGEEWHLIKV